MYKVSVITIMYNAGNYIERCARTLFEQTLKDIEFIFVDDKSTDNTLECLNILVDDYPERKNNVKIICLDKNSGQATARCIGLLNATGDYIIHCDSDDWVDTRMYELMYLRAIQDNLDCVTCNYYESDGIISTEHNIRYHANLFDAIITRKLHAALWNKMYKRNILDIDSLVYPKGNMGEDFIINLQYSYKTTKYAHIEAPLYYYYNNSSSITRTSDIKKIIYRYEQSILNIAPLRLFLVSNHLFEDYYHHYISIIASKREILSKIINSPGIYKIWRESYSEINRYLLTSSKIKFSRKIRYILNWCRIPY